MSVEHARTVTREFATGERAVLYVESRSGAVVVEGRQTDRVQVEAVVRIWSDVPSDADEAARLVERGMEQDANRVILRAPSLPDVRAGWSILQLGHRGSRVDYQVRVPLQTAARVRSRSGRVEIRNLDGRVHSEVLSGRCNVEDILGDVTVVSRSGSVQIERVRGQVSAEARSGRIRVIEAAGPVTVEARSGAIEISKVEGDLRASARSGSISVEGARGAVHARSRCGAFRYRGRVEGDFDVEIHTGPITLAVDPEAPFFIDAESHIGPVRSDLPPRRGGGGPPPDGPKVRLRTHAGPIRLTRAD